MEEKERKNIRIIGDILMHPGEFIGTEEEYIPGKGTYVDKEGKIYSTLTGELHVDSKRRATVIPFERIPEVKVGKTVVGKVVEIFESVAFVDVEIIERNRKDRTIVMPGVIPVSEIKVEYVKSIRDELRIGDIVKATVVRITPFRLELSLKGRGMGVIKGFCSICRHEMDVAGRNLKCQNCGHIETRRIAFPYGKV
jgi:exosome complex component CSL4